MDCCFLRENECLCKKTKCDFDKCHLYKDLDKYKKTEIDSLDSEKIDMSYEHGIATLKNLNEPIKHYKKLIALFLAFLLLINISLIAVIPHIKVSMPNAAPSVFMLIIAYTTVMFALYILLMRRSKDAIYFTSKEFLVKETFKYDIKLIKLDSCRKLQKAANINESVLNCITKGLNFCTATVLAATAIVPIVFALIHYAT